MQANRIASAHEALSYLTQDSGRVPCSRLWARLRVVRASRASNGGDHRR
jgi:hypothetical protein